MSSFLAANYNYSVKNVITDNTSDVFSLKFSQDDSMILAGCGDGNIKTFSSQNGKLLYQWSTTGKNEIKFPVTCVTFRPGLQLKTKNIALIAGNGTNLQHWHITSGRMLNTIAEKDNQVNCCDYRVDGKYFASAGKDCLIRVYDEATKNLVKTMSGGNNTTTAGHANRIFALKWHPIDPHILLSGGWDNTVQVWDKRADNAVRSIYGPHICGDSLDIDKQNVVLTGSWRPDHQVQLWDFGTGKMIEEIKLPLTNPMTKQKCNVYAAKFSPDGQFIAIGGNGANEAKVVERSTGKIIGAVTGLEKGIFCAAFSSNGHSVVFGSGDGSIYALGLSTK